MKTLCQKTNNKKNEHIDDFIVDFWCSCDGRMLLLRLFYGLVTIDAASVKGNAVRAGIKFLWSPNVINEQLIRFLYYFFLSFFSICNIYSCIIKTILKLCENPEASRSTGKNILIAAFHVLRALCVGWDQSIGLCCLKCFI